MNNVFNKTYACRKCIRNIHTHTQVKQRTKMKKKWGQSFPGAKCDKVQSVCVKSVRDKKEREVQILKKKKNFKTKFVGLKLN